MTLTRLAVVGMAGSTWIVFAVCMRYYFRQARHVCPAKSWLTRCAFVCTLAQLVALAWSGTPSPLITWSGVAGFVAAQTLFWWALATHGRRRPAFAFVPVAPTSLVSAGPYRLVRHPIYTAYLLAWVAGAAVTGRLWLLLTVALMGALYRRAARQEEQSFLAGPLEPAYREYRQRTGMFLPRLVARA